MAQKLKEKIFEHKTQNKTGRKKFVTLFAVHFNEPFKYYIGKLKQVFHGQKC